MATCENGPCAMQEDQFQRLLPTFIQIIELTEQEESEYWTVVSAVLEGKQIDSITSRPSLASISSNSIEGGINNKVCVPSIPTYDHTLRLLL